MSVFDIDQEGQQALAEEAQGNPITRVDAPPGTFEGIPKAVGMGIMRGGVSAARAGYMAAGGVARIVGADPAPIFHAMDEVTDNATDFWTPDANTVGTVGRVLGGLSEIVLPLAATAGNPALMVESQVVAGQRRAIREGVNPETATTMGLIEGAASAAGFKLPFLGRTLFSRLTTGALGNVALGAGTSEAQKLVLEQAGNTELAKQYAPGNWEARGLDLLMGAAFGGLAHLHLRPSDAQALLTANNAKHFQADTAPGIPADVHASIEHQAAMEAAIEQTLRGEPVVVPEGVTRAEFIERPAPVHPDLPPEYGAVDESMRAQADATNEVLPGPPAQAEAASLTAPPSAPGEAPAAPTTATAAEARAAQIHGRLEVRSIMDANTTDGVFDAANGRDELLGHVQEALDLGRKVTLFVDNKPVEITKVENGQMRDAKGQAWGTMPLFTDPEGKLGNYIEATKVPDQSAAPPSSPAPAPPPLEVQSHDEPSESAAAAVDAMGERKINDTPEIAAVRHVLATQDFQVPTGALDAEGRTVTRSAREIVAENDAAVAKAQDDTKGYEAAVNCFIGGGFHEG